MNKDQTHNDLLRRFAKNRDLIKQLRMENNAILARMGKSLKLPGVTKYSVQGHSVSEHWRNGYDTCRVTFNNNGKHTTL